MVEAVVGCGTDGSGTLPRRGRLGLRGRTRFLRFSHFKLNNALTWAVTVTVWGENSSVGAGAASAFMAITRGTIPMGRTFSKVSTDAEESSPTLRPAARASESAAPRARR